VAERLVAFNSKECENMTCMRLLPGRRTRDDDDDGGQCKQTVGERERVSE